MQVAGKVSEKFAFQKVEYFKITQTSYYALKSPFSKVIIWQHCDVSQNLTDSDWEFCFELTSTVYICKVFVFSCKYKFILIFLSQIS